MAIEIAEVLEVGPGWNRVRATDGNVYTLRGDYNWRSNNPGNIEYGPFAISQGAIASGAVPSGRERGFAIFPTLSAGEKAREVLQFESPAYRDLSIAQAISRYAPPSENNTQAYINAVTQAAGVAPGTRMSELTPQQRAAFLSAQARVEGNMRQGDIFTADGVRLPPGEIPNIVASQLDTTPQTRNVPRPQPRPQRMADVPLPRPRPVTPRDVASVPYSQGVNIPLAPPTPRQLPQLPPSNSSPTGLGPMSLATVQDMYGRPSQPSRLDPIGLGPMSLDNVQDMYGRGGVGRPPATRSVPSIPVRTSGPIDSVGEMPEFAQFLSQFGPIATASVPGPNAAPKDQSRIAPGTPQMSQTALGRGAVYPMMPQVGTALSIMPPLPRPRPVVGFPTPASNRPMQQEQRTIGFPAPANLRPSMVMVQPQQPSLRVTVNGAGSYNAPAPQTFQGSSTGQTYTEGQRLKLGNDVVRANADGSFTNERTGRKVASGTGWQARHGLN